MVSTCLTQIHKSSLSVQAHKQAHVHPVHYQLAHITLACPQGQLRNLSNGFWNPDALCLGYFSSSSSLVAVSKKEINLVCHVSFTEIMLSPNVMCFLCKCSQTICFVIWTGHFGEFTLGAMILAFPSVYLFGNWGIHPSTGFLFLLLFSFWTLQTFFTSFAVRGTFHIKDYSPCKGK